MDIIVMFVRACLWAFFECLIYAYNCCAYGSFNVYENSYAIYFMLLHMLQSESYMKLLRERVHRLFYMCRPHLLSHYIDFYVKSYILDYTFFFLYHKLPCYNFLKRVTSNLKKKLNK